MTRMHLLILGVFVLAFGAGAAATLVVEQQYVKPPGPRSGRPSLLASELKLTTAQQEEMLKIWKGVGRGNWHDENEQRRQMQKQREEAIRQLIPADKQMELAQIEEKYAQAMSALSEQRRQNFTTAVEKTKALLTPEQKQKYEQFLASRGTGRHGSSEGREKSGGESRHPSEPSRRGGGKESSPPAPQAPPVPPRS